MKKPKNVPVDRDPHIAWIGCEIKRGVTMRIDLLIELLNLVSPKLEIPSDAVMDFVENEPEFTLSWNEEE
jgi:hypothetical protein